jgi:hydroxyacylglutathione hydrolase
VAILALTVVVASSVADSEAIDIPEPEVLTPEANDGWYYLSELDEGVWAIREPRSWLDNVSYSICGQTRCILFDSGSGHRDISFVHGFLEDHPATALASHVHRDHIGSHHLLDLPIAMADLPEIRAGQVGDRYSTSAGASLLVPAREWPVAEWWAPGAAVDLGGRVLELVHVPGHSPDSIALVDRDAGRAFVGDLVTSGDNWAFLPGADLERWRDSIRQLRRAYPGVTTLHPGHGAVALDASRLDAMASALDRILDGSAQGRRLWWLGFLVRRYPFDGFAVLAP